MIMLPETPKWGRAVVFYNKMDLFLSYTYMCVIKSNLLVYLGQIKDPRRLQGQRHELISILLITIMSTMSGYIGYRPIGDFMRRNKSDLIKVLQPKKNCLPSFDVVRKVLKDIDFSDFSLHFIIGQSSILKLWKENG